MNYVHFFAKLRPLLAHVGSALLWVVSRPLVPYWWLQSLRVELWIVEGRERGSGLPLSILSGLQYTNKSYLLGLMFDGEYRERRLGRFWLWRLRRTIPAAASDCSIIVVETNSSRIKLAGAPGWFWIPSWVFGEIALPRDAAALRKVGEELRQIRHNKLEYEVTRDRQKFDDFYYNMYVPYSTGRFGDCAEVSNYRELNSQFEDSDLLLVKNQGQSIAGSLIMHGKTGPCLWDMGIRDGDRTHFKRGAGVALYHFAMQHLEEKGHTTAGLGWSRPFLRDGVLQFKRKWSQRIVRGRSHGFALKILTNTPAASAFLRENPFICRRGGSFCAAVFVEGDNGSDPDELGRLVMDYLHDGLERLLIYRLRPGEAVEPDAPAEPPSSAVDYHQQPAQANNVPSSG